LLERFASYRHAVLAYAQARPLFERALSIREKTLGPEHPLTAMSLDNLASLLRERGDLASARPLCERALTIREKTLGPEHPLTAVSLDNLASLLRERGDLAASKPLCERALAIREKVLGPYHLDTAQSLEHLGLLLRADLPAARIPGPRTLQPDWQQVSARKSPANPTPMNAPRAEAPVLSPRGEVSPGTNTKRILP
jgi:tetratricopeptide (TPR) repeat protein